MESFLVSTGLVALAEMGDKTQLLALVLAARYRRPWPIILGILVATLANHALAGAAGNWIIVAIGEQLQRWIVASAFLGMALWMLVPDELNHDSSAAGRFGVFTSTVLTFFLVEMGDKTQIATIALAVRYEQFAPIVLGTTTGMMLANVPAVLLGERFSGRLPVRLLHRTAAAVFAALGLAALLV